MTHANESTIYHILPRADWEKARAQGEYRAASLAQEGFIHFSTRRQVAGTLARYYAGRSDLVLLRVDTNRLLADLRYEESHGEFFPHLYGPLNLDAVVEMIVIETGSSDPLSARQE